MENSSYKNLCKILNNNLKSLGRPEKFEIACITEDGENYYSLILKNDFSEELSIELVYDDEWTAYFLGIHDHLYADVFYANNDIFANEILKRIVIPILENRVVHVCYTENGEWRGSCVVAVPNVIPFEFSEKEQPNPLTCRIICWNGEVTDLKMRAFAVSERKEVEQFRNELYTELFE